MTSSDNEVLIKVDNVSKKFCRDFKKSLWYGVKDSASDIFNINRKEPKNELPQLREGEFWANQNISFEVKRGECLGLIGRNGAGKTTLLKVLNGLIKPDTGRIEIKGKVGALIALGSGFNPVLTGRENIYINGSILGLSNKEIDEKLDEIIEFAEVSEAIDSPVRTYSSGMNVRLGFSIATVLNPDVLFIDEVLAVGDTNFRLKCYNQIKKLLPYSAVIFVSHNMFDLCRICTKVLVLKSGEPCYNGALEKGINVYNFLNHDPKKQKFLIHKSKDILEVNVESLDHSSSNLNSSLSLIITVNSKREIGETRVRLIFHDETDSPVAEWDVNNHDAYFLISDGVSILEINVNDIRLRSGNYRIVVAATDPSIQEYIFNIEYGLNIPISNSALIGAAYKI